MSMDVAEVDEEKCIGMWRLCESLPTESDPCP